MELSFFPLSFWEQMESRQGRDAGRDSVFQMFSLMSSQSAHRFVAPAYSAQGSEYRMWKLPTPPEVDVPQGLSSCGFLG